MQWWNKKPTQLWIDFSREIPVTFYWLGMDTKSGTCQSSALGHFEFVKVGNPPHKLFFVIFELFGG